MDAPSPLATVRPDSTVQGKVGLTSACALRGAWKRVLVTFFSVQLRNVKTHWLRVAKNEKYLLLEDEETGDVLIPLVYMKSIFEANYRYFSRAFYVTVGHDGGSLCVSAANCQV
jgi:hypothetical protein